MSALGNDAQLAVRAGTGDEAAFAALHARHHRRLVGIAERILVPVGADPEGAVQDAWVRAHSALESGKQPEHVGAWLGAIARNVCFDELDRLAARPRAAGGAIELDTLRAAPSADPAEAVVAQERLSEVLEDIGDLTDAQRRALTLHVLGGDAHEEVSRELDVEVGAVKALIYRARAQLRARRARRHRDELAYRFLSVAWPAKGVVLAVVAAIGGVTAGAVYQRVLVDPPRAPAWVPPGQPFADHAVPPGGRLPRGVALVEARVALPEGEPALRADVTVRCPAGHVVVDWMRPAALDPDVLWASFDDHTRRHRYLAGAPNRRQPTATARIAYATLSHLPADRTLTFSVLCAQRTPARDRAIEAAP